MFVCKNCGEKFDTQVNFCNQCGSSAIEPEEIPVYTAEPVYTYSAPVAPASSSPAIRKSTRFDVSGTWYSIASFTSSAISRFLTIFFMLG